MATWHETEIQNIHTAHESETSIQSAQKSITLNTAAFSSEDQGGAKVGCFSFVKADILTNTHTHQT